MQTERYRAARANLIRAVRNLLSRPNGSRKPLLISKSVALPETSPLGWLQAQPSTSRVYWSGRDYGIEVAGSGTADVQKNTSSLHLAPLRANLAPLLSGIEPGIRYYGGLRFDSRPPHEVHWHDFGSWWFALPRFEVRASQDGAILRCNIVLPRDYAQMDHILAMLERMPLRPAYSEESLPRPESHYFRPTQPEWNGITNWALREIDRTSLDKVVLARETVIRCAGDLDPVELISKLKAGTPNCFHFLFQPTGGHAFVGASPERLFRRTGRNVESEAVAGSRPRGASETDDARLVAELQSSEKELREHEFVRVSLQEEMIPLADTITLDAQPSVMRLATERHLVSRMQATLRQGVTSLDVLQALHPSPAVGGYPCQCAVDAIAEHEPFDRGWYAGPVGWIGPDAAEFAVGIRSGLAENNCVRLYSGAGIVRGSTARAEWDEIGDKIVDFTRVLGLSSTEVMTQAVISA